MKIGELDVGGDEIRLIEGKEKIDNRGDEEIGKVWKMEKMIEEEG